MLNQNTSRGLLCTALLGSLGLLAPTAEAMNLRGLPSSCADLQAAGANMGRDYLLFLQGNARRPYLAFCDTDGGTYLTLSSGAGRNFSQYANVEGYSVQRTWHRIRFDPATSKIDITDFRFTTSTGYIPPWDTRQIPYGTAGDCAGIYSSEGHANVDLTGLPFKATATWTQHGYYPAGSATKSFHDQIVNVTGGGYCGNTSAEEGFTLGYIWP